MQDSSPFCTTSPEWSEFIKLRLKASGGNPLLSPVDPLPPEHLPRPETLVPASVMLVLVDRGEGPNIILTRRSDQLRHHPGQIAFPGGKREHQDQSNWAAAVREMEEETGIRSADLEYLGYLPSCHSNSGFAISPFVARIPNHSQPVPQESEVAEIFEIPLKQIPGPRQIPGPNRHISNYHLSNSSRQHKDSILCHDTTGTERNVRGITAGTLIVFSRHLDGHPEYQTVKQLHNTK